MRAGWEHSGKNNKLKPPIFMRKLTFFIFVLVLIGIKSILSCDVKSSLNFSLYDGSNFSVVFNNTDYGKITDEVEFNNIQAGKYYVKVIKEMPNVPATPNIIFSNYIIIPQDCKIFAVIDESGHFYIYKKISDYGRYKENHAGVCNCNCEACKNCVYKARNDENNEQLKDDCRYKAMKENDFNDAIKTISDRSFESTKLDIAKQVISANTVTCEQLRNLLKTFSFEDSKIQLSEFAYDKLCDPNNISRIYDTFTFESSIQVLNEYIAGKK